MNDTPIFIKGLVLGNFKSFGDQPQYIAPFSKINIFIGQNNSGKSNILLFIYGKFLSLIKKVIHRKNIDIDITYIDTHVGSKNRSIFIGFSPIDKRMIEIKEKIKNTDNSAPLDRIINYIMSDFWFTYEIDFTTNEIRPFINIDEIIEKVNISRTHWLRIWNIMTRQEGGDIKKHWVPEVIDIFKPQIEDFPDIYFIPAIRKLTSDLNSIENDLSGLGIINKLAKLQNPSQDKQHLKENFNKINDFLRELTNNETATIEIPYDRDTILIHMDKKILPIESLGTGIHEVIILAAAATVIEHSIICLEEPELHLHPLLQRKLIQYLYEKTTNQYFITTHSAHILDTARASVFHVRMVEGASYIDYVQTTPALAGICADLGYRASDLLQSNCIIWVEGPSDRVYLNHWIHLLDPNLIEGIHYSIMFYGGKLLNHLSANDDQVEQFISLRRMNRHIAIVIDSDKKAPQTRVNDTKKRIQAEFDKGPGFAWITEGREMENYISDNIFEQSIQRIYPMATYTRGIDKYSDRFENIKLTIKSKPDKIKIAHEIITHVDDLNMLDLKKQMQRIVDFIHGANGL